MRPRKSRRFARHPITWLMIRCVLADQRRQEHMDRKLTRLMRPAVVFRVFGRSTQDSAPRFLTGSQRLTGKFPVSAAMGVLQ